MPTSCAARHPLRPLPARCNLLADATKIEGHPDFACGDASGLSGMGLWVPNAPYRRITLLVLVAASIGAVGGAEVVLSLESDPGTAIETSSVSAGSTVTREPAKVKTVVQDRPKNLPRPSGSCSGRWSRNRIAGPAKRSKRLTNCRFGLYTNGVLDALQLPTTGEKPD